MISISIIMLIVGVFLSAFFSGMETGFYRASRVRIVMSGLDGDRVSQALLKLINNPTWFVATTLIGNNVANYLTSLSIVLLAGVISHSHLAEMVMPLVLSPLLFVYGELLPKNLFYQAPNFLLRLGSPLFLLFTLLFAPAAAVLWAVGQLMERMLGQSPERIRLALARKELQQVLEEGFEAGILQPTQRQLAQSFFLMASKPVREVCTPIAKIHSVSATRSVASVLKFARKYELSDIPVTRGRKKQIVGYVRTVDLLFQKEKSIRISDVRPLKEIRSNELFGESVLQMQTDRETLAIVANSQQQPIGLLSLNQLTDPLLDGPLESLRR
jgi:putative hemolysin